MTGPRGFEGRTAVVTRAAGGRGVYDRHPRAVTECHQELTELADRGLVAPLASERIALTNVAAGVQQLADGLPVGRVVYDAARS